MRLSVRGSAWSVAIVAALFAPSCVANDGEGNLPACAPVCDTEVLYGFGPGGQGRCLCEGSGPIRTGPNGCSCGQCYVREANIIRGYGYQRDGTCPFNSFDCLKCSRGAPTPAPETTAPETTAPSPSPSPSSTPSPSGTPSLPPPSSRPAASSLPPVETPSPSPQGATLEPPSTVAPCASPTVPTVLIPCPSPVASFAPHVDPVPSSAPPSSSSSPGGNESTTAPSTSSKKKSEDDESDGMATWQIVLVICSCILVFVVAVVTLLSCYCKAKQRLDEQENADDDHSFYHNHYAFTNGQGGDNASFNSTVMSMHGRPSSAKSLNYGEPSFTISSSSRPGSFRASGVLSRDTGSGTPTSRRGSVNAGLIYQDELALASSQDASRPSSAKLSHTFGETSYGPMPSSLSRPASGKPSYGYAEPPSSRYSSQDLSIRTEFATGPRHSRVSSGSASEIGNNAFTIGSGPLTPGAQSSHEFTASRRTEPVEL